MRCAIQGHKIDERLRISGGLLPLRSQFNTHQIRSTMTLINTTATDTGYYSCTLFNEMISLASISHSMTKYVYIFGSYLFTLMSWSELKRTFWKIIKDHIMFTDGERNVVNINGNKSTFLVKAGEPVTIPCIATHPNVTISLIYTPYLSKNREVRKNNSWELM